jgi:hypothetical protein
MGLRWQFGAPFAHMRDIVIDLLVEGHDPRHGPHRNVGMSQETPNPKLAGIGMAFLQVIHLDHQGEPDLARRGVRCPAFVLQARKVLGGKPLDPSINGGPGDM